MTRSFASLYYQLCLVIILFAFSRTNANESGTDLPPGYVSYPDINVAYKVHTEPRTWSEAKQICLNEGAHLAVIDTMQKVRYVAAMKGSNVYVWIGMSRTNANTVWTTAGSGTLMPNLPWAPGKPWGSNNCLTVRGCNRGLSNEDCYTRKQFVCQISLVEPNDPNQYGQIPIY